MVKIGIDHGWYSVTLASQNDINEIYRIDRESLKSYVELGWMIERFEKYPHQWVIARRYSDGKIIGYISGTTDHRYKEILPGYIYMSRFAVDQAFRRIGVGSALYYGFAEMGAQGSEGIVGDVRASNLISLDFFMRKHGFSANPQLSAPESYHGDTPEDRYKIVVFKNFESGT